MSVIVPLHNVADFVEEAVVSLQSQALPDVEFVLVDDGSTDATFDIVSRLAETDPRIRLVRQDNHGPSAARNHGLRLARGAYVCFVDGDDILADGALETMFRAALEHDADIVTGDARSFDEDRTWTIQTHLDHRVADPGPKTLRTHPGLMYAMGPCSKLFRRQLIDGARFPEHIRLGEDQPFVLRALARAKKIYTVDAVVYHYRRRPAGTRSLTQQAVDHPARFLGDLYAMVELARPILTRREEFDFYLRRVALADIAPRVQAALSSHEPQAQRETLASLQGWLRGLDRESLQTVGPLLLAGLLSHARHVRRPAAAYRSLVAAILGRLTPRGYGRFAGLAAGKARKVAGRLRGRADRRGELFARNVVFSVAKRMPAQKKAVFAANRDGELTGNLRLLRDAARGRPGWRIVTRQRSRSVLQSVRLYHDLGRAAVVFLDDYYAPLRGLLGRPGGQVVQVWHAAGAVKRFGLSAIGARDSNSAEFERATHECYTAVVAASTQTCALYAQAFGVPADIVLPLGHPRADVFFDQAYAERVRTSFFAEHPDLAGRRIVLYAPTFRGRPGERARFRLELDLEMMAASLGDEYALIVKLHPAVRTARPIPERLAQFAVDLSRSDVNDLMLVADVLVTDYSSVVFEYSLLSRPMVFFAYDLDSYLDERGFYHEYESFVPGPVAKTTAEVIAAITSDSFDASRVADFAGRFFDHRDGKSTQRILDHFLR